MSTEKLYDSWSATYDAVENKTRDLEKIAARETLASVSFETVIELGCGTGKNTEWLAQMARRLTAIDLSEEMQAVAKQKVKSENVAFMRADITKSWNFGAEKADLITCSLILEHIADLEFIFVEAFQLLNSHGHFYVCELHPFKQYRGGKARFETEEGTKVIESFTHHISDYTRAAQKNDYSLVQLSEWFDDDDRTNLPRLICFLFKKK